MTGTRSNCKAICFHIIIDIQHTDFTYPEAVDFMHSLPIYQMVVPWTFYFQSYLANYWISWLVPNPPVTLLYKVCSESSVLKKPRNEGQNDPNGILAECMLRLVGNSYEYDVLWLMSLVGEQRAVMCWRQGGRGSLLPLLTLQPPLSLQMNLGPPPTPLHNTQVHHTLSIKHHSITPKYKHCPSNTTPQHNTQVQHSLSPSNTTQFIWDYTTNLTTTTQQLPSTPHTMPDTTHLYPIPSHNVQVMYRW